MKTVPFYAPIDYAGSVDKNKKLTDKIALIDADRYKHVVTYRMFQKIQEGNQHNVSLLNDIIDDYLANDIFNNFDARAYIFCFSAPTKNVFRSSIAQSKAYKGHRKNREDKNYYESKYDDMGRIYDYISHRYTTLYYEDIEADDLLSMLQCDNTFIFSHDGDLKQVPGLHWDMKRHVFYDISKKESFRNLIYQILRGAGKDNIPGLEGFGDKALETFQKNVQELNPEEESLIHMAMKQFMNKYGVIEGCDAFVEMWSLASTRLNRGKYVKEKYSKAFHLIETLCKNDDKKEV